MDAEPAPYLAERMKPLPDRAIEGRANPKGIPYLYVATDKRTAIAEMRPWPGTFVSLAVLETTRPLRVINCTRLARPPKTTPIAGQLPPIGWERAVWHRIDKAFSRPVAPSVDTADYAPTQVIAECFKMHRYDGIAYRSSLGPGHNLVFFDLSVAEPVKGLVFAVEGVRYKFKQKIESPCNFRDYRARQSRAGARFVSRTWALARHKGINFVNCRFHSWVA